MGDTYLRVLSFNTHLFGYTVESKIANDHQELEYHEKLIHDDDQRKKQLKSYLNQNPPLIDLFVLQEVWSAQYAHDFKHDLKSTFPSFFAKNEANNEHLPGKDFNGSGLCLQAIQGATFTNPTHFDYITHCNGGDGFDSQDEHSQKGYLSATVSLDSDFDSAISRAVSFGLLGTHMITGQNHHILSTRECYGALVTQLQSFAAASQPSLLCADFNTTEAASPAWYDASGSLEHSVRECSAFIYGVLLSGAPPTMSEAFIYSRTAGEEITPVTCYTYSDRYTFAPGTGPGFGGWQPSCVPFYVPSNGSGQVPVYQYVIAAPDGSGDYIRLSTVENDPSMKGWTMSPAPLFNAVESTTSGAVPIYEWTFPSTNDDPTLYAYFPSYTLMPEGWTISSSPAFYAYDLLSGDPGYTVDSTNNTFWASVNSPYGKSPATPTQQRIDYIWQTNPEGATTTFEFVEADVLVAEPALRIKDGTEDVSDHFPLFAIIKISDPSIGSNGVVPVMCYTYGGRYLFSTGVQPRSGSWRLICAPFFVPANNAGNTPVYEYYIAAPDGSGYYFRLSTVENDPSMSGWSSNLAFNAVDSSTPNSIPIYEWTLAGTNEDPTRYAYFPEGTIMLPGWTMSSTPAFYGLKRGTLA